MCQPLADNTKISQKKRVGNAAYSGKLPSLFFTQFRGGSLEKNETESRWSIHSDIRPKLALDRIAGTANYCLGFEKDGRYFVPSSCLLEDVRNLGEHPSQILAIMSKNTEEKKLFTAISVMRQRGFHWTAL